MSDYIEREAALKAVNRHYPNPNAMCAALVTIPAADVRPVVRGRWNRTDAYPHRLYCSVCFKTYLKNDELLERWEFPLNFCPNCGADMRNLHYDNGNANSNEINANNKAEEGE